VLGTTDRSERPPLGLRLRPLDGPSALAKRLAWVDAAHVDTSTVVDTTSVESTTRAFAALGDATRLRILDVLAGGTLCVCDLREAVDVAPNLLSYHLRILREAGLVTVERRGRWADYSVHPDVIRGLAAILAATAERTST
jgi:ArsR family transcriptional regulator, arsenate/arsenite/antimonite-responsive transcriptional repressor